LGFGKVLIAVQVALSLTLLAGALLFLRTFQNLLTAEPGFDRVNVLSVRIDPVLSGITAPQLPDVYARLIERSKAIPGAAHAALAMSGPLSGSARISSIVVDDQPMLVGNDASVREEYVSAEYFQTLGLPLLKGRLLSADDGPGRPVVAVVNEQMARRFFGDRNPLGHSFGYEKVGDRLSGATFEIVGVVRDSRIDGPRLEVPPMVYYSLAQRPENARNILVRMTGPVDSARTAFRNAITAVHPRLAVREVLTLEELTARLVTTDRLVARLTGIFSLLAVGVACLGLYGSIAFSVVRRTNEIGVRIALGATPGGVRWLILRETLVVVGIGCALGMAALWPLLTYLRALLFGLEPHDPATLISAVASLLVVGMIAGAIPAWRASRVDPLQALRAE
jgi:predicted permease